MVGAVRGTLLIPALTLAFLLPVGLCVIYVQRETVLARLRVGRWVSQPDSAPSLRRWIVERPQLTTPMLVDRFADSNPQHAVRASALIAAVLEDPDYHYLDPDIVQTSLAAGAVLQREYARLPPQGRNQAVDLACRLLERHLGRWSPHVPTVLDAAGQTLRASLADSDLTLRLAALQRIPTMWSWIGVDSSSAALVREWLFSLYSECDRQLDSVDPRIRAAAAAALSAAPFHDFDDRLATLLADEDRTVRKAALQALAANGGDRLPGSERRRQAASFLNDDDPEVAAAAERILLSAGFTRPRIDLIRRMRSADAAVRATACALALELHRTHEKGFDFEAVLLQLASDDDAAVRRAFVDAAKRAATPALVERLARLAKSDPDDIVRRAATAR